MVIKLRVSMGGPLGGLFATTSACSRSPYLHSVDIFQKNIILTILLHLLTATQLLLLHTTSS